MKFLESVLSVAALDCQRHQETSTTKCTCSAQHNNQRWWKDLLWLPDPEERSNVITVDVVSAEAEDVASAQAEDVLTASG